METVKILLATYNGENYINDQIQSILGQQNVFIDIIISDDKSTDTTLSIINENYPQISTSVNNPSTGSAAKNFLSMLKNLNFDEDFAYIAFSDQDDIWLPQKLEKAIEILQTQHSDLYCSNLTKWDVAKGTYTTLKKDFPQKKFDYLFEGGSAGCTYVFTKSFAQKLKDFVLGINYENWEEFSHDWLVYFFARSRKYKVSFDNNSYIIYRLHDTNVHGHLNKLSFQSIQYRLKKVLKGYHKIHAEHLIKCLPPNSVEINIYKDFLGGYIKRNKMILKYNTSLFRDNKKFLIFMILNLIKN